MRCGRGLSGGRRDSRGRNDFRSSLGDSWGQGRGLEPTAKVVAWLKAGMLDISLLNLRSREFLRLKNLILVLKMYWRISLVNRVSLG